MLSGDNDNREDEENISIVYDGISFNKKYMSGSDVLRIVGKVPEISYESDPHQLYCLTIFGVPLKREYSILPPDFLWMVVNIRGNAIKTGDCLYEYTPPNPPVNIAYRYILILYKQRGIIRQNPEFLKSIPAYMNLPAKFRMVAICSDYFIIRRSE